MFNAKKYLKMRVFEEALGGVGAFEKPYYTHHDEAEISNTITCPYNYNNTLKKFFNTKPCKGCIKTENKVGNCWDGVRQLLISKSHWYMGFINNNGYNFDLTGQKVFLDVKKAIKAREKILQLCEIAEKNCLQDKKNSIEK